MAKFALHRTAIARDKLSRPVRLGVEAGLISGSTTVMDYGCGRGDDVRHLQSQGLDAVGWDPTFQPTGPKRKSEVVNLGFVLNVIDRPADRVATLKAAWELATGAMVVGVLTTMDASSKAVPWGDGTVSSHGTFQKYFDQREAENLIRSALNIEPVSLGVGIFAVLRDDAARAEMLAARFRRSTRLVDPEKGAAIFQENQKHLQPLLDFVSERGRFPRSEERSTFASTSDHFGGLGRASKLINSVVPKERLELAAQRAREDLLVYLALTHFSGTPKLKDLDRAMQHDIKHHLGSYAMARDESRELLFSLGDRTVLNAAWKQANVGKTLPSHFYIHASALDKLPPVLRLYEGCARQYLGTVEGATLVKLGLMERTVSYLYYPRFDQDPHPALTSSLTVDLQTFRTKWRDYSESHNPPILHRKELFVAEDYPHREKFARLSRAEEKAGLFDGSSSVIGTVKGWEVRLAEYGVRLQGHRVVQAGR